MVICVTHDEIKDDVRVVLVRSHITSFLLQDFMANRTVLSLLHQQRLLDGEIFAAADAGRGAKITLLVVQLAVLVFQIELLVLLGEAGAVLHESCILDTKRVIRVLKQSLCGRKRLKA